MTQIFLSYAREDEAQVRDVYYRLLDAGFDVWMDKINLLPGQRWQQEIPQAIRHSDFILIFFSKRSVAKRGYIQREFRLALDTGFPEQAYRKRRSVRQWVKLWSKTRVTFHVYRGQKPLVFSTFSVESCLRKWFSSTLSVMGITPAEVSQRALEGSKQIQSLVKDRRFLLHYSGNPVRDGTR